MFTSRSNSSISSLLLFQFTVGLLGAYGGGTAPISTTETWSPVLERLQSEMKRERNQISTVAADGRVVQFTPPFVTLTYAQSIDGSIASANRRPVLISGKESMTMTHALRAAHDSILVGVNTVNNDNPSLTVRLCKGSNPKPVILDSHCSTKLSSKLVSSPDCVRPLIATVASKTRLCEGSPKTKPEELERVGCRFLPCQHDSQGRIDLSSLLYNLSLLKISSVMVEGGASVINSFLLSGFVSFCVITIAPRFLRGLPAIGPAAPTGETAVPESEDPHLCSAFVMADPSWRQGRDVVLCFRLRATAPSAKEN